MKQRVSITKGNVNIRGIFVEFENVPRKVWLSDAIQGILQIPDSGEVDIEVTPIEKRVRPIYFAYVIGEPDGTWVCGDCTAWVGKLEDRCDACGALVARDNPISKEDHRKLLEVDG